MPTYTPQSLVRSLESATEENYVRIVATWLSRCDDWVSEPDTVENPFVNVLAAATCGYAALIHNEPEPVWTHGKRLESFWKPGGDLMFAWSFAHTPASFKVRGIVIEEDSLVSV